ncbi:MAG: hypothetical protein Q8930_17030, partial [Bacillota bacterium]|nr:hypothetical protein [Bacillota bacterium]
AEKLLIKSIPIEIGEGLGMYPVIAGISKDLRFLFVFAFPHSASMASDGVAFNIYDTMTNKLTLGYKKILITLAYKDNISSSNADRENIALIAGGGREMKRDKTLFLLNVLSGNLVRLSPKEQAAMTPCSSPDGRTILYAGSIEGAGYEGFFEWMKKGNHNIYSIDIKDRRIKQLTNSGGNFDFSPICINNESFVFFRSNLKGNISMWKYENEKEIRIIENLVFSNDESYPVINYYGHFDISNYADIK